MLNPPAEAAAAEVKPKSTTAKKRVARKAAPATEKKATRTKKTDK
jgi:hypothetical protein